LHALDLALHGFVEELLADFGEGKEVYAAVVLAVELLGNVGEQTGVDVVGDEGGKGCEATAEGVEDFEEGVEGVLGVFDSVLAL
jgi:hypothetical protein